MHIDHRMYQFMGRKPEDRGDELVFATRAFAETHGSPALLRIGMDPDDPRLAEWRAEWPEVPVVHDTRGAMRDCFMLGVAAKRKETPAKKPKPAPAPEIEAAPAPSPASNAVKPDQIASIFQKMLFQK